MAAVNQWGKPSSTDVPVAEPEAQRRRLDANDSSSNSSSGTPSVTSRAPPLSPLEELPGDVVQHLFLQMDRRTEGVMAQCSKLLSSIAQQSRWDRAGSLVENGKLLPTKRNDNDVHRLLKREKLPSFMVSRLSESGHLNRPNAEQAAMTDHDIGFWLGCNYPHISLGETATPELMAGLSTASGWRSLSLKVGLSQYDLPTLLEPLIDGLGSNTSTGPRELFLDIIDRGKSILVVPEALWNGRLELVGLDLGDVQGLKQKILQF